VVTIDADLQDPPEVIPELIEKWADGAKVVYARRQSRRGDGIFKTVTADLYYRLINFLSDTPIPEEVGDFRLLDREVVDYLNSLHEQSRFLRGLVSWGGFEAAYVEFKRDARHGGHTHYTISRMMNFAIDGVTSFSTKPLGIAVYLGFASAIIGFLGIIYALALRFLFPHQYWVTGWTALFVGIMFLGGVQLITIGIIGEYIGKIYKEVQRRPQYLIKEKINIE
jgi:dolichol-phosphate mannosyltransferase